MDINIAVAHLNEQVGFLFSFPPLPPLSRLFFLASPIVAIRPASPVKGS